MKALPAAGASPFLLAPVLVVVCGVGAAAAGFADAGVVVGLVGFVFLVLFLAFFRDPERAVGAGVVSPADGRVLSVEHDPRGARVSIFMAPWSVHVNRAPLSGRILETRHRRGGHRPAFSKESVRNERLDLVLETDDGVVRLALIAGTVARRVRPYVGAGDTVERGQRIGLIAFGSRCEVTLPPGCLPLVPPGTWVRAGSTTLAQRVGSA